MDLENGDARERTLRIADHAVALLLVLIWLLHEWLKENMCKIHLHSYIYFWFSSVFRLLFWISIAVAGTAVMTIGLSGIGEMPTSAGVLVAALLGAILSSRVPKYSDRRAIIIRKLLKANKLRFGNPGKKNSCKYVITTRLKYRDGNTWNDVSALGFDQALPDWGVHHRIDGEDILLVEERMINGREIDMAVVGRMLQMWLPSAEASTFDISRYLHDNGDLKGAYFGSRGRGLRQENLTFEDWMSTQGVAKGLQLWAREYEIAADRLTDSLNGIAEEALDGEHLSNIFGSRLVEETRKVQMQRYPQQPAWWSPLT